MKGVHVRKQKSKLQLEASELHARQVFCTDGGSAIIVTSDASQPKPLEREVKRLRCEIAAGLRKEGIGDYQQIEKVIRRLKDERVHLRVRLPKGAWAPQWLRVVRSVLASTSSLRCDPQPRKPHKDSGRHVNRHRVQAAHA